MKEILLSVLAVCVLAVLGYLLALIPYLWRRFFKKPPKCPRCYQPMKFIGYYRDELPVYKCKCEEKMDGD